jgi:hypothetical protein
MRPEGQYINLLFQRYSVKLQKLNDKITLKSRRNSLNDHGKQIVVRSGIKMVDFSNTKIILL